MLFINALLQSIENSSHRNKESEKTSYANNVKQNKICPLTDLFTPNKEQGITFLCRKDYKLRDYLMALKDFIQGAQNIIAASKVNNNRIIIFLKNEDLLDNFMHNHGAFSIEDDKIICCKLYPQ